MKDLETLRQQIDQVDEKILRLFEERMEIARGVAKYKKAHGMQVFDKTREKKVLQTRSGMVRKEFQPYAEQLMSELMRLSRELQHADMKESAKSAAYQGVEGAYGHEAAQRYFGPGVPLVHMDSFEEVFLAVVGGKTDYGIVPIENSYAGSVVQNYDLLGKYGCNIVGEMNLPIEHCLLANQNAEIGGIKKIYSHEQGLMQCRTYLETHPKMEPVPYYNTAMAAKFVAESGDPTLAAIASRHAAEHYGLKILAADIQTMKNNFTRFIAFGKERNNRMDCDKASIYFTLKHKKGTLALVLDTLAKEGLNLTKIESRPIAFSDLDNFEYCFYVDVEGNADEAFLKGVFQKLDSHCSALRLLGRYAREDT